jgi:WD40 repeat protein
MMKYKLLWKYPIDIPIFSVSITADGRYIVVGSQRDNNVYLLKSEENRGELLWGYGTGKGMVESVAITPGGNCIAAGIQGLGFRKNGICLLNREGRVLCECEYDTVHHDPIISVAITYDGNYIVAREGNEIY